MRNKLESVGLPVRNYNKGCRLPNYSVGFIFERNCKFALKSVFGIDSVKALTHDMLDDATEIVDKLIEVNVRYR